MERKAFDDLKKWKQADTRKPLVVKGARQVGKTWLVQHFGEENYRNVAYINFDHDESAKDIFEQDYNIRRIVSRLSLHTRNEVLPGETLIFLDEVQECPRALESLKYFCEDAPEYHVVVAGSLLGVRLHEGFSFPVGKVEFLNVYPLDFGEFLVALGEGKLVEALHAADFELIAPFHEKLVDYYKTYLVTGGMPEVVQRYVERRDFIGIRELQKHILESYGSDFSKHAPAADVPRIIEIFDIIPQTLAKENKKFMFGAIKPSARAREYEAALLWLEAAGVAKRVTRVNKVALPLAAYSDRNVFKLFFLDVGLLGCKARLEPEVIFDENAFLEEFKGALAEQFVFQETVAGGKSPFYYAKDDSRTEVDFMLDGMGAPVPVEVKSGRSLVSKSFTGFLEENAELPRAVKFSLLPYKDNGRLLNVPIYAAGVARVY